MKTENNRYKTLYHQCETFLCEYLELDKELLRSFTKQLLDTENLKAYYHNLIMPAAVSSETVAICDVEDFIHIIDHYDELIHLNLRDKTGSYYTPHEIIDLMIEEIFSESVFLEKIINRKSIVLLEPSCGTMIFVRSFIKRLHNEVKDITYLKKIIKDLIVVDIQLEPLFLGILGLIKEIYPLLKTLDTTWRVRCCDALKMTDLNGCIDIVLGNPPYLGEKGNADFFRALKNDLSTQPYYEGRMDLYYFFIHIGINALKQNGLLSFITTNYFISADSATLLRARLKKEMVFKNIIDYSGDRVFKSAKGQHNLSFILQKSTQPTKCRIINVAQFKLGSLQKINEAVVDERNLYDERGLISLISNPLTYELLKKIHNNSTGVLNDEFDVKQGIVSGADIVTKSILEKNSDITLNKNINKGDPIFIFSNEQDMPFDGPWQNFYKNSDIQKYAIHAIPKYSVYYVNEDNPPSIQGLKHLETFRGVLEKRREVKSGYRQWYQLQWPRTADLFEQPKLVMPQRSINNTFAYTEKPFYGSADIYYIIHVEKNIEALLYLNGVVNSKLYYYWLYHRGKKKGEMLELYSTPIKNLPIIHYVGAVWQDEIIVNIKKIMKFIKDNVLSDYKEKHLIDRIIYEGFSLTDEEINEVETFYKKNNQRG